MNGFDLLNIYAPNVRAEREQFFTNLSLWPHSQAQFILLGDFNCVLSPHLDRLSGQRSSRPESPALVQLVLNEDLADARLLRDHAEDDEEDDLEDHFTYWEKNQASRLDRFYLPTEWADRVLWVSVQPPPQDSDHQEVELHLRQKQQTTKPSQQHRVGYPIRTNKPNKVLNDLLDELTGVGVGRLATTQTWDADIAACYQCIRTVKKRERQRRKRFVDKLGKREGRSLLTRSEWIAANAEELREEHLVRIGRSLERTTELLRWSFKRVADWERDQKVTRVDHIHGKPFKRPMTTADKFASEWAPILGVSHRTKPTEKLQEAFAKFTTIPQDRQVGAAGNMALQAEITEAEVLAAVRALSRHKAAGPDGLNNDFYKDTAAIMVPALLEVCNQIMQGDDLPKSFLEAFIIPLRKKGDSSDAMDYRPISLLQTSYKIFAKVIATRLQRILPKLIGESQQGFVHGRRMSKTVMMMMAQLATATSEEELEAACSRCILLLDFRKAYDTVDREFRYETLRQFGFDSEFVNLVQRMHNGTTARFLVNGILADPIPVRSGIRQGCPLAPLLFLLVVEVLGIAMQRDPHLRGLEVPSDAANRHVFSTFVDDSTVFMEEANQIPQVFRRVRDFGQLSGLHVQPTKSKLIFLNKAVELDEYEGISVVRHSETTRYLGYEVGTGDMHNKNWALRIRKIQRRLVTATSVATSVENRILILNAIVLPSLLFTAAVFEMPAWAETEVTNLYKQFLWAHATSTEKSRHKVNPGLLVTPKKAGGIGLASVSVAIKTQRTKHAIQWLTQRPDKYFLAWRRWSFRGLTTNEEAHVTPTQKQKRKDERCKQIQGHQLARELGELLAPTQAHEQANHDHVTLHFEDLLKDATSWWEDEQWVLSLYKPFVDRPEAHPDTTSQFWSTFNWSSNRWIQDWDGNMLTTGNGDRWQTALGTETAEVGASHPSIIPPIPIGEGMQTNPPLQVRRAPPFKSHYDWKLVASGIIEGIANKSTTGPKSTARLHQHADGIRWFFEDKLPVLLTDTLVEEQKWEQLIQTNGIVFKAHPGLHRFPWKVPDTVSNKHILKAIAGQAFKTAKKELRGALKLCIDRMKLKASKDSWQAHAMNQTPQQIQDHCNGLSKYQVWTVYRVATRQLNRHHPERCVNNGCRKTPACTSNPETHAHLFWECPCAMACWDKLVSHWTGEQANRHRTQQLQKSCANRQAPTISRCVREQLEDRFQEEVGTATQEWKRIWHILSSICQSKLWNDRNDAVLPAASWELAGSHVRPSD